MERRVHGILSRRQGKRYGSVSYNCHMYTEYNRNVANSNLYRGCQGHKARSRYAHVQMLRRPKTARHLRHKGVSPTPFGAVRAAASTRRAMQFAWCTPTGCSSRTRIGGGVGRSRATISGCSERLFGRRQATPSFVFIFCTTTGTIPAAISR
jgi:hypothetical protein